MIKSKINPKILDKLISAEILDLFQKNIKNHVVSRFEFANSFWEHYMNLCDDMIKSDFFKEMHEYIADHSKQLVSNSMELLFCTTCKKAINLDMKGIEIVFNPNLTHDFFCRCSEPKWEFSKSIFTKNFNFLVFNWILTLCTWNYKIKEICKLWRSIVPNTENICLRAHLNFEIKSILENIYMSFDSIKFNLFIFDCNAFLDERLVTDQFLSKSKSMIKSNQSNKNTLLKTIENLLEKNNKNCNFDEILQKLNMINLHDDEREVSWIIDERNNLMHNYFNVYGNFVIIGFPIEEKLLHICFLLLYDNVLFFYFLINCFNS